MQEYYSYCVILLVFVFPAPSFLHAISEHTRKKKERKKISFFPALNSFVNSSEKNDHQFHSFSPQIYF